MDACTKHGVLVCNTPDAVTEPTADLGWTLLLGAARGISKLDRYARSRTYPERGPLGMCEFWGRDLTGRNLLIIGAGRIGLQSTVLAGSKKGRRYLRQRSMTS